MNSDRSTIPGLAVKNIGSRTRPHNVITGQIILPGWNGYYLDHDSRKFRDHKTVTSGAIELWVDGMIDSTGSVVLMPEQVTAYWFVIDRQEQVKQNILHALKQDFPRLLSEEYGAWDQEQPFFPKLTELTAEFDFMNFIGPESISIGEDVKEDTSYISWRFRCRWDVEHGLEIVTHRERVIYIAPDADPWKIYKDNGTYDQEMKEYEERISQRKPARKKRWWQFY